MHQLTPKRSACPTPAAAVAGSGSASCLLHPRAIEINRAPAKVQSALLESMEEQQITVGGRTYGLPELFFVMATQSDGHPEPDRVDARGQILALHMAGPVEVCIAHLVQASRHPGTYSSDLAKWIQYGASPRASLAFDRCARVLAWLDGRDYVSWPSIASGGPPRRAPARARPGSAGAAWSTRSRVPTRPETTSGPWTGR